MEEMFQSHQPSQRPGATLASSLVMSRQSQCWQGLKAQARAAVTAAANREKQLRLQPRFD
tara:strand:- start:61 stop:240 length:180 start_codon:yes stop_codon:yes gene_type:complete